MRVVIDTRKMAGAIGLAGGVLVLGVALARAVLLEPAPLMEIEPAADMGEQDALQVLVADPSPVEALSDRVLSQAVSRAPFDPERRPPAQRYRLPGEQMVEVTALAEQPPVPPLRVLGTIAGIGGGIAVIQEEGERPKVVSVGQMIGEYRVASVQEEVVTVSSGGWEIELALVEGTATVMAESQGRFGRGNQRSAQDMQQMLESYARAMQERLGSGFRIQMEGGRAYIIGADGTRREVQLPSTLVRGARGNTRTTTTRIPPENQSGQGDNTGTSGGGY